MAIKNGVILQSENDNEVLGANFAIYDKNGDDISLKEIKSNKVTSIDTSTTTGDDTNYPAVSAVKTFVNSSVSTNTATFRGTFNVVSDLGLTIDATDAQIIVKLAEKVTTVTNNDYCFVSIPQSETLLTTAKEYRRYKYSTESTIWAFEYALNNSSFTETQWSAINSGVNSSKVSSYDTHINSTSNPHSVTASQVGLGSVENKSLDTTVTADSGNYITSGAVKTYVDTYGGKIDTISVESTNIPVDTNKNVDIKLTDFNLKIQDYSPSVLEIEEATVQDVVDESLDNRTYSSTELETLYNSIS